MSIFMIKTHKLKMLQPMCNYTVIYFFWECNTHNVFNLLRRNVVLSLIYSTGWSCLTSSSRPPGLLLSWRGFSECSSRPWTSHMWTWGLHMGSSWHHSCGTGNLTAGTSCPISLITDDVSTGLNTQCPLCPFLWWVPVTGHLSFSYTNECPCQRKEYYLSLLTLIDFKNQIVMLRLDMRFKRDSRSEGEWEEGEIRLPSTGCMLGASPKTPRRCD